MSDAYTIRIFVADGDPEGLRIIDQFNWTGLGAVFPRQRWPGLKLDDTFDFEKPGIYLLWGFLDEDGLPKLYIGQGDCVSDRIDDHFKKKDFWQYCAVFTSTSSNFNSAHAQWLEYALVRDAQLANMCHLENGNQPQEPALAKCDRQDAHRFFHEVVRILPLVGLRALEKMKPIVALAQPVAQVSEQAVDTIIVPARPESVRETFLGKNCWHAVRIAGGMLDKIKWCACYESNPTSAITYVAPVKHIEPYGQDGKFCLVFSEPARKIGQIPFGDAPKGMMTGSCYCTYAKLTTAKKLMDVF